MSHEFIGKLSGVLVIVSVLPYAWRVYQGKIKPSVSSWSLWVVIGLALLLTYDGSGAKESIWPAIFGFTNPMLVTILAIWRHGRTTKFTTLDKACAIITLASLGFWLMLRGQPDKMQFALYLAIVADIVAAVPQIVYVWKHPADDRPFAWGTFALGYGLAIFAVSEPTVSNYALPVYMLIGGFSIALPLSLYRIRKRLGWREWI